MSRRADLCVSVAQLGLDLLSRAQAIGALAVRERQWELVRTIALQPVADHDPDYWGGWIFHAEVMAARANLLRSGAERPAGRNPLVLAQEHALRLASLRRDVVDDDALVTSLCRFDMLAAFSILGVPVGRSRDGAFLAYFASWYQERTDPIVVELIRGGAIRDTVFPHDDSALARAIEAVAANASHMTNAFTGWHGYEAPQIVDFLQRHAPSRSA